MRRFLKWLLIILVIAGGFIAVYFIYNPGKAITLVFPDLDRISNINTVIRHDSADVKIDVVLENRNPYKLVIDTLTFHLLLNDTDIATQEIPLNLDQTSFDADTIRVPLELSIKKIRGIIRNLQDQDSTWLGLNGSVVYETVFGRVKLNFDRKKRIAVPVPPKLKIVHVTKDHFDLSRKMLYVTTGIEIINKGKNLDLQLTDVTYDLRVRETLHSEGTVTKLVNIKPQSSVIVEVPMEIKVFHPLKTALLIKLDRDRLPYTLHLKGTIKENISDNAFSSPVEVEAEGMMELRKEKSPR